jgi:RNA polymerase sigma factor (sigma-70 family)
VTSLFKFAYDAEFLERFRAGRHDALERIYRAYVGEVEVCVRRVLSRKRADASATLDLRDVTQDVFVHAFGERARRAFDGTRAYGPFLGTLSRNLALDSVRKRRREVVMGTLDALEVVTEAEPTSGTDEASEALADYVKSLPELLQAVYEQRYVSCRTQQQASQALGLSRQQLRTLEQRFARGLSCLLARRNPSFVQPPHRRAS